MLFTPKLFLCESKPVTFIVAIEFDKLASLAHYKINTKQLIYWTEDLRRYVNYLISIQIQPSVTKASILENLKDRRNLNSDHYPQFVRLF